VTVRPYIRVHCDVLETFKKKKRKKKKKNSKTKLRIIQGQNYNMTEIILKETNTLWSTIWCLMLVSRDEKQQLLLGIRRANRQPTNLSSSVLSSDSMHIGILAAAAHAAANNSPFTVFYNPRSTFIGLVIC
jgi:hypothetical protein